MPMDPSSLHPPPVLEQEDEWDTDGFVIPSLGIEESDKNKVDASAAVETSEPPSQTKKEENNIYLGPHGAPPSQSRQQEQNPSSRRQWLKQKLKEADRRNSGTGRENKVENLRELVGGGNANPKISKGSPRDWLDPHCNESQFEKQYPQ